MSGVELERPAVGQLGGKSDSGIGEGQAETHLPIAAGTGHLRAENAGDPPMPQPDEMFRGEPAPEVVVHYRGIPHTGPTLAIEENERHTTPRQLRRQSRAHISGQQNYAVHRAVNELSDGDLTVGGVRSGEGRTGWSDRSPQCRRAWRSG